jgi:trans-aconitate 2-methyltransferase
MEKDVASYYDEFKLKQIKTGINIRHRTIFRELKKAGLKPNHAVLEIGCGIGTVTKLMAGYLKNGSILGVDISPQNIRFAEEFVGSVNSKFLVSDMSDFVSEKPFDFIVLPDVLEHIPIEQHFALFQTLARYCKETTVVFINMPSPHFQNYISRTNPALQQIIDQEVHTDQLLNNAYPHGFYLWSLTTYSLGYEGGDYQRIIFTRQRNFEKMNKIQKNKLIVKELRSRIPF